MWWEKWIPDSYVTASHICAIESVFSETEPVFHFSILQLKNKKVELVEKGTTLELETILKKAKKANAPVILAFTGQGIILKKVIVGGQESLEVTDLIKQHLPTIQLTDFYVQFYANEGNSGFLTICRKEQVNGLIALCAKEKVECVDAHVGPLICLSISSIIKSYNRLSTSSHELQLSNGAIESVHASNKNEQIPLHIDNLHIEPTQLITFASGFGYLTRQHCYKSNDALISQLTTKHQERLKIKFLVMILVIIVFVTSIINSIVFFQKFEEDTALSVQLNLYESKNTQITKLLEDYQKKKQLIEQAGIFDNQKRSLYADKIAATLPDEILLRELYVNPEIGETEKDSLTNFTVNQIIIKGNCQKSLLLNEWITVLKNKSFVKTVNLEKFTFNADSHLPNFILKLETN